jgi:hypothetical protein
MARGGAGGTGVGFTSASGDEGHRGRGRYGGISRYGTRASKIFLLFSACDALAARWPMWLSPSSLRVAPWSWSLWYEA